MIAIGLLFVRLLYDCFRSRRRLEAEIRVLRHELIVLQQRTTRVHLRWADRALFISGLDMLGGGDRTAWLRDAVGTPTRLDQQIPANREINTVHGGSRNAEDRAARPNSEPPLPGCQSVGFGAFFRANCKRTVMADRSLKL